MPISTVKIRLTVLCLSGFELYSRWVPLLDYKLGHKKFHGFAISTVLEIRCS